MTEKYYLFEDEANSIATILKTNTKYQRWLEELCNIAEVSEEADYKTYRDYVLSYKDKRGGARLSIDESGTPILGAMDNRILRRIPIDKVPEYQKKLTRNPEIKPVLS